MPTSTCSYHTHTQSYRMHLKSSNGAIDVLVCPEDDTETQSLQSPHPPPPTSQICRMSSDCGTPRPNSYASVLDQSSHGLLSDFVLPKPQQMDCHCHHTPVLVHQTCTKMDAGRQQDQCGMGNGDITAVSSLSYSQILGPGASSDLEISLSSAADVDSDDFEGLMDHLESNNLLPIDMAMFEHLSPPLQTEEFSFSMDNSTEGIHDLFDLR